METEVTLYFEPAEELEPVLRALDSYADTNGEATLVVQVWLNPADTGWFGGRSLEISVGTVFAELADGKRVELPLALQTDLEFHCAEDIELAAYDVAREEGMIG